MNIAGVLRKSVFSPNSNDRRVMEEIACILRGKGHIVTFYSEEEVQRNGLSERVIFSMARSEKTLDRLSACERNGAYVLNPPQGVRNCMRWNITRLLEQRHVLIPPACYIELDKVPESIFSTDFPCWLKRADGCSEVRGDVCYITTEVELRLALRQFAERGIRKALLTKHINGDIVKFYGVAQTSFFYWYYPTLSNGHSKFGLEKWNGPISRISFSDTALQKEMNDFAVFSSTVVYGGDCIVDKEGRCWVIDFNDFPSFSPCVAEAALAIAGKVDSII